MRVKSQKPDMVEADMTPMIDMVFNLIAFFMVLINFSQSESHDMVVLPSSVLVKPPEAAIPFPITIHVGQVSAIYMGAEELTLATIRPFLNREKAVLRAQGKEATDATIIIRAHKDAATGHVQEIVAACQEQGFDVFALRVKEDLQ
jgi:biopolymer transport protein ExbD